MISRITLADCVHAAARAVLPPVHVPLSTWANDHVRLSSEGSVQAGHWQCFPYQTEPLDCMGPHSPYQEVVLMWASQMSKTQLALCLLAHVVAADPGPCLIVEPTLPMAEALSKDRIAPMFRDMPVLQGIVADPRGRDSGSTIFHRRFRGGHVTVVGSNSPAGLASRPIRFLFLDEVDRFEASAGAEGDPAALAIARTRTFWNRKVIWTSSPTIKDASRIAAAFEESDQREYYVPCPFCGAYQVLEWKRVEWPERRPQDAEYRCEKCEKLIPHHRKAWMVAQGVWRPQNPGSRIAGFRLSELYSPWRAWGEVAEDWLKAQGNPERLRAFINTSLAELWDDAGQAGVTEADLMARREQYGPMLPEGAAVVTCGVDVQDNRVEASVFAWGRAEECWLMVHRVIPGDPSTPQLWAALDDFLLQPWRHPFAGQMPIHATCIDSGGHFTQAVCNFADARRGRRVWAIKGDGGARPVWPRKESKARKGKVWLIGVDSPKSTLAARLRVTEGPGRVHFPVTVGLPYFEQLNSEFLRTTYRRGRPERTWERRKGRAAEGLDCAVYAYAALCGLRAHGVDLDQEAARVELLRPAATRPEPAPAYPVYRSKFVSR
jgi:phage terminase large subunit GpA-like protein